jgi:hypothetical protein
MSIRIYSIIYFCWNFGIAQGQQLGYINQCFVFDSIGSTVEFPIYPKLLYRKDITTKHQIKPILDFGMQTKKNVQGKARCGGMVEFNHRMYFLRLGAFAGVYSPKHKFNANGLDVKSTSIIQIDPLVRFGINPSRYFSAQLGLDRNFYGDGFRSLFLSDNGRPYPFASANFKLGPICYQTMLSFLFNNSSQKKYNMSHYFLWNIRKKIQFQFFESVIFNSGDTISQRGFDPAYLNPFVIIRPQEYALGSGDNVLLGVGASWKIIPTGKLYGQFMLDDFLLSALLYKKQYWGNKFAFQLGWKQSITRPIWDYFLRCEANLVRPYTYSHLGDALSYTHDGQVLSHPLGANFWEFLVRGDAAKRQWNFTAEILLGQQGIDSSTINYGNNIFISYTNRPADFGVQLLQGLKSSFLKSRIIASYGLKKCFNLNVFAEILTLYETNAVRSTFSITPIIGIRSPIWNDYRY